MSTATLEQLTPLLVSDLPPAPAGRHGAMRPPVAARLRAYVTRRRFERAFERAVRSAGHAEYGDLLAVARRD